MKSAPVYSTQNKGYLPSISFTIHTRFSFGNSACLSGVGLWTQMGFSASCYECDATKAERDSCLAQQKQGGDTTRDSVRSNDLFSLPGL